MLRRGVPAVVLLGLLAGCGSSSTSGRGTPEAVPVPGTSAPQGLPVPDDPTQPPTTTAAPPTTAPTTAPPTAPPGRPCPADVAATLPGHPSAILVAGFTTSRFRLYYRGISRAAPAQATTLPARTIPGGYQAGTVVKGDAFVYRVAQRRLIVTKNGRQILADPITGVL